MFNHRRRLAASRRFIFVGLITSLLLSGCGGGGGGGGGESSPTPNPPVPPPVPAAPALTLSFALKQVQISWAAVPGASYYRLWQSDNATTPLTQVGGDLTATTTSLDFALHQQLNARYQAQACNTTGCTDSPIVMAASQLTPANLQKVVGYVKASNTGANDYFSSSVALSKDGNTLAVGACGEDGANGNQADNSALESGAVYIFSRAGNGWNPQAYLKASDSQAGDRFGVSIDLSADGNTLAVGATGELSSGALSCRSPLLPSPPTPSPTDGAVYIFERNGSTWQERANITASNTDPGDAFGFSVKLSADGNTLAVGAPNEASSANTIEGNATDNSASGTGAVYVFVRATNNWTQQSYIKASNSNALDFFGWAIALSADGNTLAVGAYGEDSNANTINGNETNNSASSSGAAYVFVRNSGTWSKQAYVKASNTDAQDRFGWSVALSADGSTLAVGAYGEDSNANTINGNEADNGTSLSGAVYVFGRTGTSWAQQAYVKASNTGTDDRLGWSVALSADGNSLMVGAYGEDSNATGVQGEQTDNSLQDSGAVYFYARKSGSWTQQVYVKATNTGASDRFGASLALSADAKTMAVGAWQEASGATGIGGNQTDNSADRSGAVYLF
jgi:hypothetical protein